jgi:hypothetical protein
METGTIISGTLRPEDLIPAFISAADDIKDAIGCGAHPGGVVTFSRIDDICGEIKRRMGAPDYFESDAAAWDLETLFELLNDLAPEGTYFGSVEGDGADFGFWEIDEN